MSLIVKIGGGFLAVAGVGLIALSLLPARSRCADKALQDSAQTVARTTSPGVTLGSFGEVTGESTDERLVCRTLASGDDGSTAWLSFSVEKHGDDQVFIKFGALK